MLLYDGGGASSSNACSYEGGACSHVNSGDALYVAS